MTRTRKCEICDKKERHCTERMLFAKFPLREDTCKQWVKAVGKEDLVYLPIEKLHDLRYVCGSHFRKRDFTKSKTRLKKRAIPMLDLRYPPLSDELLEGFPLHMARSREAKVPLDVVQNANINEVLPSDVVQNINIIEVPSAALEVEVVTTPLDVETEVVSSVPMSVYDNPVPSTSGATQKKWVKSPEKAPGTPKNKQNIKRKLIDESTVKSPGKASGTPGTTPKNKQNIKRKLIDESTVKSPEKAPGTPKNKQNIKRKLIDESTVKSPGKASGTPGTTPKNKQNIKRKLIDESTVKSPEKAPGTPKNKQNIKRKLIDESTVKSPEKAPGTPKNKQNIKRKLIDESTELTPRKKKLVEDLRKTRCTLRSLRKSAILIEKIQSPVLKEIVLNAAKNQSRHNKGRRWTMKNKISALAIHKRSPKTYRFLNQLLPLPSEKTLQNMLKKVPMQPGINKSVLLHLKKIAPKKQEKDKICCLLFDEMAIKQRLILNPAHDIIEGYEDLGELGRKGEVADHALVFMLQGLHQKHKQPLAFYFTKGTISSPNLANIIKNIITEVSATGFHILNTVCDQGPTNLGALKLLREGSGPIEVNNYFIHNGQKVFIVYDIPHLFKSIRNNFLNQGSIKMCGKKGEWAHLLEVEKENNSFLYLSKISEAHVNPKYKAKMRVKYAAQILSNTVSAVLKLLSKAETDVAKKQKLLETAEIIQELDSLFDLTNGPSGPNDKKIGKRENVSVKTNHLNAWAEWIKKMETIEFINKNGKPAKHVKCVEGYKTTLKSLRDIWQHLHKLGFKYLNLRQLNQDALENLFGLLRQQSVTNKNPTAAHFISGLKAAVVTRMSAPQIRGNCEKDKNFLLTGFEDVVFEENKKNTMKKNTEGEAQQEDLKIKENLQKDEDVVPEISIPDFFEDMDNSEEQLLSIPGQAVVYVSGYLASRLLKNNSCPECKLSLSIEKPLETGQNTIYDYIHLREWWTERLALTYPSLNLCNFVQCATNIMENEIVHILHEKDITELAITIFHLHADTRWFKCKTHEKSVIVSLYKNLSTLLVRRACQKVNIKYAAQEETSAAASKKAQQLGKSK